MPKTIVVIPTYNEIENLTLIIEAVLDLNVPDLQILIVDDNSPDGTGKLADELASQYDGRLSVLHRKAKGGLGPAYIAGFKQALRLGADYIIQMDADFSHQPKYILELIAKLEEGYDGVLASRYVQGGSVDPKWSFLRKLLSWFANRVYVHYILGIPTYEATGGYRIWRRNTLIGIDLDRIHANGYVFQVELTYVSWKLGFKLAEIPIHFPDRVRGKSKMTSKIASEAAVRVWDMMYRHRSLTPQLRRTEAYSLE
jgi:dolichol-phosphate mannosyltransferase